MSAIARCRPLLISVALFVAACDHPPPANGTFDLMDHLQVTVPAEAICYDRNTADRQYHLPAGGEMDIEVADSEPGTATACQENKTGGVYTLCFPGKRVTIRHRNDRSDDRDTRIVQQVAASIKAY